MFLFLVLRIMLSKITILIFSSSSIILDMCVVGKGSMNGASLSADLFRFRIQVLAPKLRE